MFMAPLVAALWFLWSAANEQIESTLNERQGVSYVQPVLALVKVAQGRRLAAMDNAPDLASWQSKMVDAFAKVQARQTELGVRFGTAEPFAALSKIH